VRERESVCEKEKANLVSEQYGKRGGESTCVVCVCVYVCVCVSV